MAIREVLGLLLVTLAAGGLLYYGSGVAPTGQCPLSGCGGLKAVDALSGAGCFALPGDAAGGCSQALAHPQAAPPADSDKENSLMLPQANSSNNSEKSFSPERSSEGVTQPGPGCPLAPSGLRFQSSATSPTVNSTSKREVEKTEQEWKKLLTPLQYYVTRQKGTERAFTGQYWNCTKPGVYRCVCCGAELFSSEAKFLSKSGWPSFWQPIRPEAIETQPDYSHGMIRTEVLCRRCGAHLGHVFSDGTPPTGLRYCINSAALRLEERLPKSPPATP